MTRSPRALLVAAAVAAAALTGCSSRPRPEGAPTTDRRTGAVTESDAQRARNQDVMTRLAPSCAVCHGEADSRPFFASLDAFETLLVFNSHYVVPGQPGQSELLRILAGQGTGSFKQMPLSGSSFAALDSAGQTSISMADLTDWIQNLQPVDVTIASGSAGTVVQRVKAEQIYRSLYAQLGLDDSDFWSLDASGVPLAPRFERYPMRPPTMLPMNATNIGHDNEPFAAWNRFYGLGGPDWFGRTPRRNVISPTFTQTLVQMGQAWCAVAVAKPNNTVFFKLASPTDTSATAGASIRKNIGWLYLTMLSEPPPDADVDLLYTKVFQPYEAQQSTAVAWTATCAALVRHPLWVVY